MRGMDSNAHTWAGRFRARRPCVHRPQATDIWEGAYMSDHKTTQEAGPVPLMQQLLDSPFLLLFIGVGMPTVIYIIWGIMEIIAIPVAP